MIKVIKSEDEYEAALAAIESLVVGDPAQGTPEAEQIELLALLIKAYEDKHVRLDLPDPVEAIRFRMAQQGLSQKDLIPFIGSRSKVSEVLAGKRPLSLPMIRALHAGLGIPANVLLQEQTVAGEDDGIDWSRFPLAEMAKRGWLRAIDGVSDLVAEADEALAEFFAPVGSPAQLVALYKRTRHVRGGRSMDPYALAAWTAQIMRRAETLVRDSVYLPGTVTLDLMVEIARLSPLEDGPRRACEHLAARGIPVVIEKQLSRTSLDGAAVLLLDQSRPVIGLTLRHDRIDNFWFCLMHELAHIMLHLTSPGADASQFFDDLDVGPGSDPREVEADNLAGEALIPSEVWHTSAASKVRAVPAVLQLAHKLHIHPAIVAGRVRHQYKDFRVLGGLVGQGEVRRLFPEVSWVA